MFYEKLKLKKSQICLLTKRDKWKSLRNKIYYIDVEFDIYFFTINTFFNISIKYYIRKKFANKDKKFEIFFLISSHEQSMIEKKTWCLSTQEESNSSNLTSPLLNKCFHSSSFIYLRSPTLLHLLCIIFYFHTLVQC